MDFFNTVKDVVSNAVVKKCELYNDTEYEVVIVDHDGTRSLEPGYSEGNYLVAGFGLELVMKFSGSREEKIHFPSSRFENRTHKMSTVFEEEIERFKREQRQLEEAKVTFSSPNYSDTPSVKHLELLKWRDERGRERELRLVNKVSAQWRSFGRQLGQQSNQLDVLEERSLRDPDRCWLEVMRKWLEGGGCHEYPATWEGLYRLLEDLKFQSVATELREGVRRHFGL